MSAELQVIVALAVAFIVVALGGTLIVQQVRWRDKQQRRQAEQVAEDFLKIERIRLKANTARVLKEVDEVVRREHPEANRRERRAVATIYRKQINTA